MSLSDTTIKAAKCAAKEFKLADSGGLYLLVTPAGGKLWRLKYRFNGKEQKLSLGSYPTTSLKVARHLSEDARRAIAEGRNPAHEKKRKKITDAINTANTFKAVAEEVIEKGRCEGRKAGTVGKAKWMLSLLEPALGSRPIAEIEAYELLDVVKKIEAVGHHETAQRLLSFAGRVFRYAVVTTRARSNPAADLRGALVAPKVKHYAAILEPGDFGALLRAIDGFQGQPATQLALQLAPHVFVRAGELRQAEWSEFDLEGAVWRIPATRMKMGREHVVPLSSQSVAILNKALGLTGRGRFVFQSVRTIHRPMSENTINAALRRMGYTKEEMTGHGFRSTASTLLNESGKWSADAIEHALAHKNRDHIRTAYHRGTHWAERVKMAQWWSDHLDVLRQGAKIVPLRSGGKA